MRLDHSHRWMQCPSPLADDALKITNFDDLILIIACNPRAVAVASMTRDQKHNSRRPHGRTRHRPPPGSSGDGRRYGMLSRQRLQRREGTQNEGKSVDAAVVVACLVVDDAVGARRLERVADPPPRTW
mmetsp:Transcript_28719/g.61504  ORF Transcript_28719/g.61504 Transcript_28719/m.61504 type:complete len:128 (-) Transcript_28719:62-445(-)